jgi:hypothetical protein
VNKIQIKTSALICITLTIASFAGCATRTGSEAAKFLLRLSRKIDGVQTRRNTSYIRGRSVELYYCPMENGVMDEAKYKPAVLIAKTESALKQGYPECKQAIKTDASSAAAASTALFVGAPRRSFA